MTQKKTIGGSHRRKKPQTTITWLHISDLHACPGRTGWDANHVTESLCDDLQELQRDHDLRPDFIFFTGDVVFGQLDEKPGVTLEEQYKAVRTFLERVRCSFRPELTNRDIYIVPGNHDVNRDDVDPGQTSWLKDPKRSLDDIISMMQAGKAHWRRFMERLDDFGSFLRASGYDHLLTDDRNRLIFGDARELAGLRIGIAGFNSAWSCYGGKDEKGRLWCGGKYQVEELRNLLSKSDFTIALIHHPGNWFVPEEDPNVQRLLQSRFQFVLHGHEHQEWVNTDARTGHTTVWAGACYNRSDKRNGFNVVQLDRKTGKGKIWLREYKETGGGWIACNIRELAPHGTWDLKHLQWFKKLKADRTALVKAKRKASGRSAGVNVSKFLSRGKAAEFERRLCEALVRKYDYLELFGADIPRESQRHALSVAYVSLNLSEENEGGDDERVETRETNDGLEQTEKVASFVGARPVDEVFDQLSPLNGRLLIRGVAGGGKSTLLRWAAIQAAKFNLEIRQKMEDPTGGVTRKQTLILPKQGFAKVTKADGSACLATGREIGNQLLSEINQSDAPNWHSKIPFLIRLRDCPDGSLPRPSTLPAIIAKELPDPPPDWIDQVLTSGRGLLLLDGVDEVPPDKRDLLAREIHDFITAYPDNYFIVSTRPGAVDKGWLSKLNFVEASIEPMSQDDQAEFIDKWYSAVSTELRLVARRTENFDKLAASLKQELNDTPSIARLAIYPLLCAMICALYRERNQKLPETQAALCEDLCKMLLHRRERETPDMKLVHLPPDYRKLDYDQKKYIVSELAKFMVQKGVSSLEESQADLLLRSALQHFPDHAKARVPDMRKAFVERSGLLRPSGANRIDFLHNTLKEYLAAGRFVADNAYALLAKHADDDAWQPVILFAAALPTPGFASKLMTELLKAPGIGANGTSPSSGKNQDSATTSAIRNRRFFAVRCRNVAFRLDPKLVQRVNRLASKLFPPNTIADAEALATFGNAIIPHLEPKHRLTSRQKVACIRALRRVGGAKAKTLLKKFAPGVSKPVLLELLAAATELNTPVKLSTNSVDLSLTSIANISSLKGQTHLRSLNLAGTRVSDLGPIATLVKLQYLSLAGTHPKGLKPLSALAGLQSLDLSGMRPTELAVVGKLKNLKVLILGHARHPMYFRLGVSGHFWRDTDNESLLEALDQPGFFDGPNRLGFPLAIYHRSFRHGVHFGRDRQRRVDSLRRSWPAIDYKVLGYFDRLLRYGDRATREFCHFVPPPILETLLHEPLLLEKFLYEIRPRVHYEMSGADTADWIERRFHTTSKPSRGVLTPLSGLKHLRLLSLASLPIMDLSAVRSMRRLGLLSLSGTLVADITPLQRLTQLRSLDLALCPVTDVTPLRGHVGLRALNLGFTDVDDLSPLESMNGLRSLNIAGTFVHDLSSLFSLRSLRWLVVGAYSNLPTTARRSQWQQLRALKRGNSALRIDRI